MVEPMVHRCRADGRFRRVWPIGARSGEGPLCEPTAVPQAWRREPLLMPPLRPLTEATSVGPGGWTFG